MLKKENNWWNKWGSFRWELFGYLALGWTIIAAALIQGIQSYGKLTYFITLFPYVVLTIMLGYVATLDGFDEGLQFYMVPDDWSKLGDFNIWYDAATQIFYSLSVGSGSQLILSSYNGFRNNAHRDALLIGVFNSLTSIYAGFSVFGVIGFLAKIKNVPIESVVSQGPGLAFIVYPEALAQMDVAPMFSFFFFFMLILLAMSSACGSQEAAISAFLDEFPSLRTKKKRAMMTFLICFSSFLGGISMVFDSGFLLFTLMDARAGNAMLLMGLAELIIAQWLYGSRKMMRHVKEMQIWMPTVLKWCWLALWTVITPLLAGVITVMAWVNFTEDNFEGYVYPPGVQFMGWGLELIGVAIMVLGVLYAYAIRIKRKKPIGFKIMFLTPSPLWGPRKGSGLKKKAEIVHPTGIFNEAYDDVSSVKSSSYTSSSSSSSD